jgi:hypothetical protein
MSHARKQIRDAVVALVTDLATTGRNVFPSRVYSLADEELPSLSVFTIDGNSDEVVTKVTLGNTGKFPLFKRDCPLLIEGHAKISDDIDDVLDQISLEVEVAMSDPLTIGERTVPAQLRSTSKELSGEGEDQIGVVRLLYIVTYVTAENTPDIVE